MYGIDGNIMPIKRSSKGEIVKEIHLQKTGFVCKVEGIHMHLTKHARR